MKNSEGIRFVANITLIMRDDVKLIQSPLVHSGQKAFPNARTRTGSQGMRARIPTIEAAHHGNFARIRRPHAEASAGFPIYAVRVSSKLVVDTVVIAFIEKIDILIRQKTDVSARRSGT